MMRLIQAFRLGDQHAGNALFRKYEPEVWAKKRLAQCRRSGGAANEAFAQALKSYDPTCGPFRAYLPKYVAGALRGILEDRMRNGIMGSGRVGRWLSGAWEARKVHTPGASSPPRSYPDISTPNVPFSG